MKIINGTLSWTDLQKNLMTHLALWVETIIGAIGKHLDILQEFFMDLLHLNAQHPTLHAAHLRLLQLAELNVGLKQFLSVSKATTQMNKWWDSEP